MFVSRINLVTNLNSQFIMMFLTRFNISDSKFWRSIKFNGIRKNDEKVHQLLYEDLFQRLDYSVSLKLFIKNEWLLTEMLYKQILSTLKDIFQD